MKKFLALILALVMSLSLVACGGDDTAETTDDSGDTTEATESALNVGVFYYNYSDAYITTVRNAMDGLLTDAGITFNDFDGAGNQANQLDQINTAISNGANLLIVNIVETSSPDAAQQACDAAKNAGIPIIFFNREVENSVVDSYENCAFVGTDAAEAGHMQGEMIGEFLLENYDAVDLNGDGTISYVLFKGQEGNKEAEFRTQYSVEDADAILTEAGKPALSFYDPNNTSKYLVDTTGNWSSQAATDYMNTILASYSEASKNMVELVIANNDDMALGAIDACLDAGMEQEDLPFIVGVDATPPALEAVAAGTLQGTVQNDAAGQAEQILAICCAVMDGKDPGTTLSLEDGKYAWLEYTTVTAENLAEFLPEE